MTDNPTHRGGQGQGRPDEYYDDRYGRPEDREGDQDPRGQHSQEQRGYPPQGDPGYGHRQGYPERGGYPEQGQGGYPEQGQGGYPPQQYEQRPPAGYGPPQGQGGYPEQGSYPEQGQGGYPEQGGYRQAPGGYPPPGGQPGYGGDYGRQPAPPRQDDYGRQPGGYPVQGGGYPEQGQGGYPEQGYGCGQDQGYGGQQYGRQEYGQPDYGRYGEPPAGGGYGDQGYGEPGGGGYDYGPPGGAPGGGYGGGYGQADYPAGGASVTLQLDDGSGRTYQLREGANVIGRGQDAQFRLPDTGVSRRHLEIRWDGQVALLADLNSTNGTTVNNAPVQEWQLADGDVIRLGHSEIIVRVH